MELAIEETHLSVQDYLDGEKDSGIKYDYVAGRVYAMSGGTVNHQRVSRNFLRHSANQLSGKPCEPTSGDLKVRIDLGDEFAFYYPDAAIVCKPLGGSDRFTDSPTVILEVLSPSTRRNDEVQKFRDYLTIPSLQVYILAEADSTKVTIYRRKGEKFHRETVAGTDAVLDLPEVEVSIHFTDLYRDVELS